MSAAAAPKPLAVQAPRGMRNQKLADPCNPGRLLTIDEHGIITGLDEAQVADLVQCGFSITEGHELLTLRGAATAYAEALRAADGLEQPLRDAILYARAGGHPEAAISAVFGEVAKSQGVLLPQVSDLAPPPAAETKSSAPKPAATADKKAAAKADKEPPPVAPATAASAAPTPPHKE